MVGVIGMKQRASNRNTFAEPCGIKRLLYEVDHLHELDTSDRFGIATGISIYADTFVEMQIKVCHFGIVLGVLPKVGRTEINALIYHARQRNLSWLKL